MPFSKKKLEFLYSRNVFVIAVMHEAFTRIHDSLTAGSIACLIFRMHKHYGLGFTFKHASVYFATRILWCKLEKRLPERRNIYRFGAALSLGIALYASANRMKAFSFTGAARKLFTFEKSYLANIGKLSLLASSAFLLLQSISLRNAHSPDALPLCQSLIAAPYIAETIDKGRGLISFHRGGAKNAFGIALLAGLASGMFYSSKIAKFGSEADEIVITELATVETNLFFLGASMNYLGVNVSNKALGLAAAIVFSARTIADCDFMAR